jgi:hypothetical protein
MEKNKRPINELLIRQLKCFISPKGAGWMSGN